MAAYSIQLTMRAHRFQVIKSKKSPQAHSDRLKEVLICYTYMHKVVSFIA